jgi:hypothetical protein
MSKWTSKKSKGIKLFVLICAHYRSFHDISNGSFWSFSCKKCEDFPRKQHISWELSQLSRMMTHYSQQLVVVLQWLFLFFLLALSDLDLGNNTEWNQQIQKAATI